MLRSYTCSYRFVTVRNGHPGTWAIEDRPQRRQSIPPEHPPSFGATGRLRGSGRRSRAPGLTSPSNPKEAAG